MSTSEIHTPLTDSDITRIAKYLQIPLDRFLNDFVVITRGRMRYDNTPNAIGHMRTTAACPFLRQGLCGINAVKPQACREEKPTALSDTISCSDWHKMRVGWLCSLPQEPKEVVIYAPTANAGVG